MSAEVNATTDTHIVQFIDVAGVDNIARDLGWTTKRVKARATRLRNLGADEVLTAKSLANAIFLAEYFELVGTEFDFDLSYGMLMDASREDLIVAIRSMRDAAERIEQTVLPHAISKAEGQ